MWPELRAVFNQRPYLAQPFMPHIRSEGEYSLIYFHGRYSHAILKTPAPGDFRVQEEYGGIITAVSPPTGLLLAGGRALAALDETPLYARVDLVRNDADDFLIMEFELIEPSLYLRMDPAAPPSPKTASRDGSNSTAPTSTCPRVGPSATRPSGRISAGRPCFSPAWSPVCSASAPVR